MATIRQVAKKAGVSIATVSRVLSADPDFNVKKDTQEKVLKAADELQYTLPPKRTSNHHFGCILSHTTDKYSDPFFTDILLALESEAKKNRAEITVSRPYRELEDPSTLKQFLNAGLDGVFIMERVRDDVMDAIKKHIPHIILINNTDAFYDFDNIGFDHGTANWQVMQCLLDHGYKRIALISGASPGIDLHDTIRYATYAHALNQAGIEVREELVRDCRWDFLTCKRQIRELMSLDDPPDAIFAGSDSLASVVLGTLFSMNINCPKDVGVVGFNNINLSAHMAPPLTTIAIPTEDIGRAAVCRMMEIISDKDSSIRRIQFPTKLIERESLK